MTNREWIELFFSKSYENQINDLVLEDVFYEIPRESLMNYVLTIINIPYDEFLDYIDENNNVAELQTSDIPYQDSIQLCTDAVTNYLLSVDNCGVTATEFGGYCHNTASAELRDMRVKSLGARNLRSAEMLGLVFCYYDHWYLNCIGYLVDELTCNERNAFFARALLRTEFFSFFVPKLYKESILLQSFFSATRESHVNRYINKVSELLDYIILEAANCNIKIYNIEGTAKVKTKKVLNQDDSSMSVYRKEISKYRPLDLAESIELARAAKNGNIRARNELVERTTRLAYKIAKRFVGCGLPLEDLVQEANVAVINAINTYDPDRGFHFASYAISMIYLRIRVAIGEQVPIVNIPANIASHFGKVKAKQSMLYGLMEREPLPEEVNINVKDEIKDFIVSSPDTLTDFVEYSNYEDIECENILLSQMGKEHLHFVVEKIISSLFDHRVGEIVKKYYGIDLERSFSLDEIGLGLNLTRERVRQIKEKALRTIRKRLNLVRVDDPEERILNFRFSKFIERISNPPICNVVGDDVEYSKKSENIGWNKLLRQSKRSFGKSPVDGIKKNGREVIEPTYIQSTENNQTQQKSDSDEQPEILNREGIKRRDVNTNEGVAHSSMSKSKSNPDMLEIEHVFLDANGNVIRTESGFIPSMSIVDGKEPEVSDNASSDLPIIDIKNQRNTNGIEETRKVFPNHGKKWSLHDSLLLKKLVSDDNFSIEKLSLQFGRTEGAIVGKLNVFYIESLERKLNISCQDFSYNEDEFADMITNMETNTILGYRNPSKLVFLLMLFGMISNEELTSPTILFDDDLKERYKEVWDMVVPSNSVFSPYLSQTFVLLAQEKFWSLTVKEGLTDVPQKTYYDSKEYSEYFTGAELNHSIFRMLQDKDWCDLFSGIVTEELKKILYKNRSNDANVD